MTSILSTHHEAAQATAAEARLPVRLRLKPPGPAIGYVDGGWWPRSRDLVTELKTLLPAVVTRLGLVEWVSYHLSDWNPTIRKIRLNGSLVRLGGYRTQHPNTVDLGTARQRYTLLVVPPRTSPHSALHALSAAAAAGSTDPVERLLEATAAPRAVPTAKDGTSPAEQRWEAEGGHLRQDVTARRGPRRSAIQRSTHTDSGADPDPSEC